ncbi:MAG: MATE family efflux transporter [Methanobrevibacter arboriphilus]|uniref:MATE family efflux transporter n=1 Tax=Methanobrevibacter arboriphilus TaxID=39441 RepID=A0A843ALR4_METAZ|nr:MATE family efflux transporter [Methanobrevibacter arboriphilus]MBF4467810.1 MATE family efflux transporter [Methanobrevibacter arboriphilus]
MNNGDGNDKDIIDDKKINNDIGDDFKTEGVSTILGDPKKAILKLSGPMIIAMLITSFYSLIDGVWVAGLGHNALAAIGFISPIFLMVMGFSQGLGVGATSVISRFIAKGNKTKADNAALHIILLTVIFAIISMVSMGLFLHPILEILGAGVTTEAMNLALSYGNVLFAGSIFLVFTATAYGILLGEGNVKKTTYAMSFGAILNIILDPIFIYVFNWGMAGVGFATVVSLGIVSVIILYWFRRDTYINFSLKNFDFNKNILKKILAVGMPAGAESIIVALLEGFLIMILVTVSGTDAVAVYSLGWVVIMIAIVPVLSVTDSVVPVVGASFGAERYEDLEIIQNYSIKIGTLIAVMTALITFILAPYIAGLFTYSPETTALHNLITDFLRVMTLFCIFIPAGYVSLSIFQGLGKGLYSFILNLVSQLIFIVIFAYILAIPLGMGQYGVWWGIIFGNIIGSIIGFTWSKLYIRKIIAFNSENEVF